MANAYTCSQVKEIWNKTSIKEHRRWMKNIHPETHHVPCALNFLFLFTFIMDSASHCLIYVSIFNSLFYFIIAVLVCLFVCWYKTRKFLLRLPSWARTCLFLWCFADTQLAHRLQQERTQVVCSNREARKHPARRHSRNSCHMFVGIVVWFVFNCACTRSK